MQWRHFASGWSFAGRECRFLNVAHCSIAVVVTLGANGWLIFLADSSLSFALHTLNSIVAALNGSWILQRLFTTLHNIVVSSRLFLAHIFCPQASPLQLEWKVWSDYWNAHTGYISLPSDGEDAFEVVLTFIDVRWFHRFSWSLCTQHNGSILLEDGSTMSRCLHWARQSRLLYLFS